MAEEGRQRERVQNAIARHNQDDSIRLQAPTRNEARQGIAVLHFDKRRLVEERQGSGGQWKLGHAPFPVLPPW